MGEKCRHWPKVSTTVSIIREEAGTQNSSPVQTVHSAGFIAQIGGKLLLYLQKVKLKDYSQAIRVLVLLCQKSLSG